MAKLNLNFTDPGGTICSGGVICGNRDLMQSVFCGGCWVTSLVVMEAAHFLEENRETAESLVLHAAAQHSQGSEDLLTIPRSDWAIFLKTVQCSIL